MSEQQHTPEPWRVNDQSDNGWLDNAIYVSGNRGENLTRIYKDFGNAEANARRIVACVNWCAGNSTGGMERAVEIGRPYSVERDKAIERELELTKQRDKLLLALEGLTEDIQSLIGESCGVAGLHMNGDVAPWDELEAGGRFERLTNLPVAHAAIASVKGST